MPLLKLTKTAIEKVVKEVKDKYDPNAPGADLLIWDTESRGFGIRVTPTGKATFIAQGRVRGTKTDVRLTIGTFGAWVIDDARRRAEEYKHQFEDGLDPRDLKKQDAAMKVTLQQVCDSYIARGKLKASTATEYKRHIEKVFTAWKDKPIVAITEDDVRKRHRELVEKGLDGKKGAPASANAVMVTLRILINYASRQYRRADGQSIIRRNPVDGLHDHWAELGSRTDRYIDKRKIGEAWNKLWEARDNPKNRDALAGIDLTIFLLLTGARRMEGAALTWDRVNIDEDDPANCWWHIPESAAKNGRATWLPLSSQAVALLKLRPKRKDEDDKEIPYVFPSWSKAGHIMDTRTPLELLSDIAGKHLSAHDLRRTFTNIAMRECLIEKFRTDLLSNHVPAQADVTARNYLDLAHLDWLQPEIQRIGDWIEEQGRIAAAKAAGKNVVPLRA
jgi:integrase